MKYTEAAYNWVIQRSRFTSRAVRPSYQPHVSALCHLELLNLESRESSQRRNYSDTENGIYSNNVNLNILYDKLNLPTKRADGPRDRGANKSNNSRVPRRLRLYPKIAFESRGFHTVI